MQYTYVDDLNSVVRATVSSQGTITYVDEFRSAPDENAFAVDWNNTGTELAMGSTDNRIYIWKPATNEAQVFSTPHLDDVIQVSWSPDGNHIASISRDNVVRIWQMSVGINCDIDDLDSFLLQYGYPPDGTTQYIGPDCTFVLPSEQLPLGGCQLNWNDRNGQGTTTYQGVSVDQWNPLAPSIWPIPIP